MKSRIYTLLALIIYSSSSFAQAPPWAWAKSATGSAYDEGYAVCSDLNGNVYVAGNFESGTLTFGSFPLTNAGPRDFFLVKYDPAGTVLWAQSFGGSGFDGVEDICVDPAGNVILTGFYNSSPLIIDGISLFNSGGSDMFVVKFDPTGNAIWANRAGGNIYDDGYGTITDNSGNVFVVGIFQSSTITFGSYTLNNGGDNDVYLVKYDSGGVVQWAKRAGGSSWDNGFGVGADALGNAYISGYFGSSTMTFDGLTISLSGGSVFIAKYDPSGNAVWATNDGGSGVDLNAAISTDQSGNSYLTGYFTSSPAFFGIWPLTNSGGADIYIAKYDASGGVVWAIRAGGSGSDVGYDVTHDGNGNAYLTGYFGSSSVNFGGITLNSTGGPDVYVTKYDNLGSVPWAVNPSGAVDDIGRGIYSDANGNVYAAGAFYSSSITFGSTTLNNTGNWDVYIAKMGTCNIAQPTITPDGPTSFCTGGSVMLTSSSAPTYAWSTGATTQSITVTSSGNYMVTVSDGPGCSATSSPVTVTVYPNPVPTITPDGPTIFCFGENVVLTSSVGLNYIWSNSATTQSITVTSGGVYSVTVNNGNGCSEISAPVTITVYPNPTPMITANGSLSFCDGGSVTLFSTAALGYQWSSGQTTQSVVVTSSGIFTVTTNNGNGCFATSAPVTVTVNPIPQPIINPTGPTTFCDGGSVVLTSSSADSYFWNTGEITQSIIATSSGNYCVYVTVNGCVGVSCIIVTEDTVSLGENHQGASCGMSNGMINLFVTDGIAPFSFSWSNGATTEDITNLSAGTYTVTVTDGIGCDATLSVVIAQNSTLALNEIHSDILCFGDNNGSIDLTVNGGTPSYTYSWSNGANTEDISNLTCGNYTVVVMDANSCSASITVSISCPDSITILSSVTDVSCFGGNDGNAVLSVFGGTPPYTWNPNLPTPYSLPAGAYTFTATDANGCTEVEDFIINQPYEISVSIFSTADNGGCSGTATATASGGTGSFDYLWSNGATTDTTGDLCGDSTYSVTVTDDNDCEMIETVTILSTGIGDIFSSSVIVYPNPANELCVVSCELCDRKTELKVFDLMGKEIYKTSFTANCQLLTANWPSGIYYLQLSNDDGTVTKKLVVQR